MYLFTPLKKKIKTFNYKTIKEKPTKNRYEKINTESDDGFRENENQVIMDPKETDAEQAPSIGFGPLLLPMNIIQEADVLSPGKTPGRLFAEESSPLSLHKSKFEKTKRLINRVISKDSPHLLFQGSKFLSNKLKLINFVKKKLGMIGSEGAIFETEIFTTNEKLRRSFHPNFLKTVVNHEKPFTDFSYEDVLPERFHYI